MFSTLLKKGKSLFGSNPQERQSKFEEFGRKTSVVKKNKRYEDSKLTADSFLDSLEYVVEQHYAHKQSSYSIKLKEYFQKDRLVLKLRVTDRINLLSYADNWRYMQDHEIELFMREEWHKNRLLLDLLALWTVNIEDFDLMTLEDFQEHYKEQKDFVANVTYILFEHSLTLNKTDWKKRLVKSVAHFILTDNAHWPVVRQVLMMLLPKEYSEPLKVDCYDIQRLKINQQCVDIACKGNMLPRTTALFVLLSQQHRLNRKILIIGKIRKVIQQQIREYQTKLISQGRLEDYVVQDNCQFINAYAYCIVKGNVKNIVASLYEMKVLMGPDYDLVLMERGVDKIRVDLEIAINELTYSQSKIV